MVDIFDVAEYFLYKARGNASPIKLQKLAYYAQGWHLAWNNRDLFKEDFQAWVHGPANYGLYKKYENSLAYSEVGNYNQNFDLSKFNKTQLSTLSAVWKSYGDYNGKQLESSTHEEEPWINARKGLPPYENSNRKIHKKDIKKYFKKFC